MKTYNNLYDKVCSQENLLLAYAKARKRKTLKSYVIEFEKELHQNILLLRIELITQTYKPKALETFTIRDPKTRKISKSDFRDRIVHHAICNVIESIFDKTFIYDSYANRIGKGTLNAIKRFEYFQRKVTANNTREAYVLKADIKKYFENVDNNILLSILKLKILDEKLIRLIELILKNHKTLHEGRGMPLGNLTSQFFANVYLNELDQYIKHELQIKYYIRYVDDFIIMVDDKKLLETYKDKINLFLQERLSIGLHPEKTKIYSMIEGVQFLGLRIFPNHKLLAKRNIRKCKNKILELGNQYDNKEIEYDIIFDFIEGWTAYVKKINCYKLKNHILKPLDDKFCNEISTKEYNRHLKAEKSQNP
jgi:retron-type reverse transcriptase